MATHYVKEIDHKGEEYRTYYDADKDFLKYGAPIPSISSNRKPFEEAKEDLKKNSKITGVVFTGGGAKGVAYVGVVKVLHEQDILRTVNKLAGSSAGAITACLLGCLASIPDYNTRDPYYSKLNETLLTSDFGLFLDLNFSAEIAMKLNPKFTTNPLNATSKAGRVLSAVLSPISAVFETVKGALLIPVGAGAVVQTAYNGGAANGNAFLVWIENEMRKLLDLEPGKVLTFAEYKNKTGVDIVITATRLGNPKTVYFSAGTTPDVYVSNAVRASMSFPGLFRPMKIGEDFFIDGGVFNNYPLYAFDFFDTDRSLIAYNTQVIGFVIKERDEDKRNNLGELESIHSNGGIGDVVGSLGALHGNLLDERAKGPEYWLRTCYVTSYAGEHTATTTKFSMDRGPMEIIAKKAEVDTENFMNFIRGRMFKFRNAFPYKEYVYTPGSIANKLLDIQNNYRKEIQPLLLQNLDSTYDSFYKAVETINDTYTTINSCQEDECRLEVINSTDLLSAREVIVDNLSTIDESRLKLSLLAKKFIRDTNDFSTNYATATSSEITNSKPDSESFSTLSRSIIKQVDLLDTLSPQFGEKKYDIDTPEGQRWNKELVKLRDLCAESGAPFVYKSYKEFERSESRPGLPRAMSIDAGYDHVKINPNLYVPRDRGTIYPSRRFSSMVNRPTPGLSVSDKDFSNYGSVSRNYGGPVYGTSRHLIQAEERAHAYKVGDPKPHLSMRGAAPSILPSKSFGGLR
jgi:NTE family protein